MRDGIVAEPENKVQPRAEIKMPRLKDMSLRKSLRLLQSSGVEVEVRGTGRVVDQQPAAGTPLQQWEKNCPFS